METKVVSCSTGDVGSVEKRLNALTRENWRIIACVGVGAAQHDLGRIVWTLVREAPSREYRRD